METKVFIDTHVLIWLYEGEVGRFSKRAVEVLERAALLVSPITLLETDFLCEIKKIRVGSSVIFSDLEQRIDLQLADGSYSEVIKKACLLSWTRDPFDRLLVAHASLLQTGLITKDRHIKKHYKHCIW